MANQGHGRYFAATDALALAPFTKRVSYLEDDDWVVLKSDGCKVYQGTKRVKREIRQSGISGALLLISQINDTTRGAYQFLIDAAIILYFIPFLYMFLAAIKLSYRKNRASDPHAVLIPGGIPGVWIASGIAFAVTLLSIGFSVYPPGDASDRLKFQLRLLAWVVGALGVGLALYWRGARSKKSV